ncbi:unnamed protein product [Ilex paraguariensis]|uniref:Uncharacterized protein n=1 Tax=Ilex paraguariensis TaxID=185542 RepID=A0ABC8UQH7_9AQUA
MHKISGVASRALNLLRLALLWSRKGGVFKRRLIVDLTKYLKNLLHGTERGALHYGEREFSFDDTPVFHVKMHRPVASRFKLPRIPCINPQVDFAHDFEFDDDNETKDYCCYEARNSFLKGADDDDDECEGCQEMIPFDEEGIDLKAEKFIAKFYNQMKLQRQRSYIQYNEMLNRGSG